MPNAIPVVNFLAAPDLEYHVSIPAQNIKTPANRIIHNTTCIPALRALVAEYSPVMSINQAKGSVQHKIAATLEIFDFLVYITSCP